MTNLDLIWLHGDQQFVKFSWKSFQFNMNLDVPALADFNEMRKKQIKAVKSSEAFNKIADQLIRR